MKDYSRDVIISGLLERNNEVVRWLYLRVFRYLEMFVSRVDGIPLDALDIFHEGLLILLEKIRGTGIPVRRNIPEYLYGICRYLWYRQCRRNVYVREIPADEIDRSFPVAKGTFPVYQDQRELRYILFLRYLPSLDMKCRRLLEMYLDRRGMETIQRVLSYRNRNSVYRKKFGCLRKLAFLIRHDPDYAYLL